MDFTFALVILLQISLFTFIGYPLSLYFSRDVKNGKVIALLTSAPIFGVITLLLLGLIGLKLQVSQYGIVVFLFMGSLILSGYIVLKYWRRNFNNLLRLIGLSLIIIFSITCGSIVLYTPDTQNIELNHYFPLTNDDTFSYIAQIDQIRFVGALTPQYMYPAGFYGVFSHAVNIAAAVTSFVAGQSEFFSLETHVAFFTTIRCVIPLMAIGIFSILVLLGIEIKYSIFGTAFFLGGNFCFGQIFQQFIRSAYGDICAIGFIILVFLALQSQKKTPLIFLCGLVSGVFAATSPEAHPFYLIILFCFSLILVFFRPNNITLIKILKTLFYYGIGLFCGVVTLIPGLYIDLLGQSPSLMGHPGDWVAQIGFFMQSFGILPVFVGNPLNSYGIINIVLMIIIFGFVVISPVYVIIKLNELKKTNDPQLNPRIFLGVLSSVFIFSYLLLFLIGRGYALQKVSEYFCFVPAIICSVVLNDIEIIIQRHKKILTLFLIAVIIFLFVFLSSTIPLKLDALNNYHNTVISNPDIDTYSLTPLLNNSVKSVDVDLRGSALNMFLYQNRMTGLPISFKSTDTHRFYRTSEVTPTSGDWVFLMSHPNTLNGQYLDINRPPPASIIDDTQLVRRSNYVKTISEQSNWLAVEGTNSSNALRWLSNEGRFEIMSYDSKGILHVNIYPGPDLNFDNCVQIIINGTVISNLTPDELPKELNLTLSNLKNNSDVNGEIQITGHLSGIRQIRVGGLYIQNPARS